MADLLPEKLMSTGPYLLLLALWGQFGSESPPPGMEVRDVEIALHARQALLRDESLGKLNLGVGVDYGVATIWGPVPSRELAAKAKRILKDVRGIYSVRDEMSYTSTATDDIARSILSGLKMQAGPLDVPPRSNQRAPSGSLHPAISHAPGEPDREEVLSARTNWPEREERRETTWPSRPSISLLAPVEVPGTIQTVASPRPVSLLTPQPEAGASHLPVPAAPQLTSLPVPVPSLLRQRLEDIRASDNRFREIEVAVADGSVVLTGQVAAFTDLIDFARRASRVPQVNGVDTRGVKVGP